ncbi:hypothetical protein Tco_1023360 [Tanacetum coccineum]
MPENKKSLKVRTNIPLKMLALYGDGFDWSAMLKNTYINLASNAFSDSEITDKSKKGIGYHVVSPHYPLSLNAPTKLDLSYSGLDEFKELEFNKYCPWDTVSESTIDSDKESDNSKENTDDSLEKDKVIDNESSSVESLLKFDKETVID